MSNLDPSPRNLVFWLWASAVITVAAGLGAYAWPEATRWRVQRATAILQTTPQTDLVTLRAANVIDPTNPRAASAVATEQLQAGRLEAAGRTLTPAASRGTTRLDYAYTGLQLALEQADQSAALHFAELLMAAPAQSADQDAIIALAFKMFGKQERYDAVIARQTSPEAAQRLSNLSHDNVAIAAKLNARQLVRTALRVLAKAPASLPRNALIAQVYLDRQTPDNDKLAVRLYQQNAILDPTDIPTRQALITLLKRQGDSAEANRHQARLTQLQNGRP